MCQKDWWPVVMRVKRSSASEGTAAAGAGSRTGSTYRWISVCRSITVMMLGWVRTMRRSTAFFSSRTLPGHSQAHLADLVEEDRAPVRHLEQPEVIAIGASETAAHVAEERRFEQRIRNAGAVERDERRERAAAALVDQPCDHFLPDAAFAGDEHLRFGTRRVLDLELDGPNRRADAQE